MAKEVPMDLFRAMYVNSYYPMLDGYAYKADCRSIEAGRHEMWLILNDVEWIEDGGDAGPILHMNDGRILYVYDSDDFPQPTDECWAQEEEGAIQDVVDGLREPDHEHRALSNVMIHPYVRWRQ